MTLWEKLDAWPPCLCRLLARRGKHGLTHREISKASGLSLDTVWRLSFACTWDNFTIEVARKFMVACGVQPLRGYNQRDYMRRRKMHHVVNGPVKQRQFYNKLLLIVGAEMKRKRDASRTNSPASV